MRPDGEVHRPFDLTQERVHVPLARPVGRLGKVYRHVLEPAEPHALQVLQHVIVRDSGPQPTARRERHSVAVKDEIGRPVLAGHLTGKPERLKLIRIREGLLVDVEVALREGKDVSVLVPLTPDLQHRTQELSGRPGIILIGPSGLDASRADCLSILHVIRDSSMHVEVQKQRLSPAAERTLRTRKDQVLRFLLHLLEVHVLDVGGVQDVNVAHAQCTRVIRLHRRKERVQVAGQGSSMLGRSALGVQISQLQPVFLQILDRVT